MNGKAIKIFSGTSNRPLVQEVAKYVGCGLGTAEISQFECGEIYVRIGESVRGADVFVIQSFSHPVNDRFVELLIMVDALKRASAGTINAMIPYYGYGRQEKQDLPREPISAKMVADVLTSVGVNRVITFDLHAPAIQGFFNIPVDHMTTLGLFRDYIAQKGLHNAIVISPDAGRAKTAEKFATSLDVPMAFMHKRRPGHNQAEIAHVVGDVKGKVPIIVEDMIDTGGTIMQVVETLLASGARPEIVLCAAHPVFSSPAYERLAHPAVAEVVVTDSIPVDRGRLPNLTVLSVAPLLGEAIQRIHHNLSMSTLFT